MIITTYQQQHETLLTCKLIVLIHTFPCNTVVYLLHLYNVRITIRILSHSLDFKTMIQVHELL